MSISLRFQPIHNVYFVFSEGSGKSNALILIKSKLYSAAVSGELNTPGWRFLSFCSGSSWWAPPPATLTDWKRKNESLQCHSSMFLLVDYNGDEFQPNRKADMPYFVTNSIFGSVSRTIGTSILKIISSIKNWYCHFITICMLKSATRKKMTSSLQWNFIPCPSGNRYPCLLPYM